MDFPLSQRGRDDAAQIAQTFRKQAEVDEIYASPLLRAYQTAEAFSNGEIWQVDYSEQGQKHAIKSLLFSEGRQHRA